MTTGKADLLESGGENTRCACGGKEGSTYRGQILKMVVVENYGT